ncbi:MAG: hypothetical protein AVDCRST_MAG03-489, partial [uncultured Rubrobacteraceae bacterium]
CPRTARAGTRGTTCGDGCSSWSPRRSSWPPASGPGTWSACSAGRSSSSPAWPFSFPTSVPARALAGAVPGEIPGAVPD